MSYRTEKQLSLLYPLIIGTSVSCCITSAMAWNHWKYVLNICPLTNCGCFLYGRSTYNMFEGGHISYCHFATYGLIIPLVLSIFYGIYHGYRICMGTAKRKSAATTLRQRSGDMIVVTSESELNHNSISPHYWAPSSVVSCIMAVYTLVYASIYTDGFETTCKAYRETLIKEIQGSGNIVPVVKARLSCAAIFDFMDYLVESTKWEHRRYGRINSAACYYIALVSAWIMVAAWIWISVVNVVNARRTKSLRI